MLNYAFAVFGIVVSVILFLIGYHKTIGATKERITAANAELEKTLVRRIVLEKYTPALIDLSRLIEGKARDYRVRETEILSTTQLLNTLYTRVMESDLLPAEQREEILGRIVPILSASEVEPIQDQAIEELTSSKRRSREIDVWIAFMALLASSVGALIPLIPGIRTIRAEMGRILPVAAGTVLASLVLIAIVLSVLRLKAREEEPSSRATELSKYIAFEDQVRKTLEVLGPIRESSDQGVDFVFDQKGKKVLIAVKTWSRPMPVAVLSEIAERLRSAARQVGAVESIIVAKTSDEAASGVVRIGGGDVKIMTLTQLRNYLAHS